MSLELWCVQVFIFEPPPPAPMLCLEVPQHDGPGSITQGLCAGTITEQPPANRNFSALRRNEPPSTKKAESHPATLKPTFAPARLCTNYSQASLLSSAELLQPTQAALSLLEMSEHGVRGQEGQPALC